MQVYYKDDLLFTNIAILFRGKTYHINNVVIDTGSAHCIIEPEIIGDTLFDNADTEIFYGVNNVYSYLKRRADAVILGSKRIDDIDIYFGAIDENINGILGLDLLIKAGISLDFNLFKNATVFCGK